MKQMEVTIMGQGYILACPDGGELPMLDAVGQVDREMCSIRDSGKIKARERIAVLAALNLAYTLSEQTAAAPLAAAAPLPRHASAAASDRDGVAIDALVRRIDSALREDGQLL